MSTPTTVAKVIVDNKETKIAAAAVAVSFDGGNHLKISGHVFRQTDRTTRCARSNISTKCSIIDKEVDSNSFYSIVGQSCPIFYIISTPLYFYFALFVVIQTLHWHSLQHNGESCPK